MKPLERGSIVERIEERDEGAGGRSSALRKRGCVSITI